MKLSVVIPAHNESEVIGKTVRELTAALSAAEISHEIVVVNDNSSDRTEKLLKQLVREFASVRYVNNCPPHGFGHAVRKGLSEFSGDAVAIYMADGSDTPQDLIRFFLVMCETGTDCVFGTRFSKHSKVVGYPTFKFVLNRLANNLIRVLFGLRYNDVTNAFKLYRKNVIEGLHPLLAYHFNLTVELPLKAIVRGYRYEVVPNDWFERRTGISKLQIKEMGSRYLFIILYCWIEKWFSRGDYRVKTPAPRVGV